MGKNAPTAPSATSQIAAQSAANEDAVIASAKYNAIDQNGPWGNITYTRRADGTPTAINTNLSSGARSIFNDQMDISQKLTDYAQTRVANLPQNSLSYSGFRGAPGKADTSLDSVSGDQPFNPDQMVRSVFRPQNVAAERMDRSTPYSQSDINGALPSAYSGQTQTISGGQPYDPRTMAGNLQTYEQDAANAQFSRSMSMAQPEWAKADRQMYQTLSDRGIPMGSEAFNSTLGETQRNRERSIGDMASNATLTGGQEAQRKYNMMTGLNQTAFGQDATRATQANDALSMQQGLGQQSAQQRYDMMMGANNQTFNQNLGASNQVNQALGLEQGLNQAGQAQSFGQMMGVNSNAFSQDMARTQLNNSNTGQQLQWEQQLRNQQIGEVNQLRNSNINDAMLALNGSPGIQSPTQLSTPQYAIQPVDAMGAYQNQYNAQQQTYGANMQGIGTLVGTGAKIAMMSSSILKGNRRPSPSLLDSMDGLAIDTWEYLPELQGLPTGRHIGPMAEDFKRITGAGDGKSILFQDALGVLFKLVKELRDEVRELKAKPFNAAE